MTTAERKKRVILCVYGAALLYYVLKLVYYALCVGAFPDLYAHLSYLIEMTRRPALVPDFAALPLYTVSGGEGATWTMAVLPGAVNYLGHPSLYYLLMLPLGAVKILSETAAQVDTLRLCLANIFLTSCTTLLAFRLGYKVLKNQGPLVHSLYAAAIVTLPELGYVGAGLNNDNLAYLGYVIFLAGLLRYGEDKLDLKTYELISLGFFLGSFAKLTAALVMLVTLGAALVISIFRTRNLKLILNRAFPIVLPALGLFLAYELIIHSRYGAWQPGLANVAPEYFKTTAFYIPPENRVILSLTGYLKKFITGIGHTWSSLYGHEERINVFMDNVWFGLVYWVPVLGAVIAMVLGWIRKKADTWTAPVVLGFLGTLLYHFYSNWSGHLRTGYLGGLQARYYLFLIVPFALIACRDLPPLLKTQRAKTAGAVLAVLLILCWLAGDAPRLLIAAGLNPLEAL